MILKKNRNERQNRNEMLKMEGTMWKKKFRTKTPAKDCLQKDI